MEKSKETWRAYSIILSGYQQIQIVNTSHLVPFLGVLALLGIATISFVISVCPSIRMEQLGSHWISEDLVFDYSNSVKEFQDPLKSDKKGHFTC
jgi:hypothetical protein